MTMEEAGHLIESLLRVDLPLEIEKISEFIRSEVGRRGARGVVLGLSGGLDSSTCAYLCARCLPKDRIHLFSLPERDSHPATQDNAKWVAKDLDIPLEEMDMTGLLEGLGVYAEISSGLAGNRSLLERSIRILGKLSDAPALYPWAQGYAFEKRHGLLACLMRRRLWTYAGETETFIFGKVRARMLVLSLKAMQLDCLLLCTTDRSEKTVGFYDPHGDGVGDIAPLSHLYKTQIRALAKQLGVPDEILRQPSSGDLAAGLPNETAIGLRYEDLDRILAGLSLEMSNAEIAAETGIRQPMIKAIREACRVADERRKMPVMVEQSGHTA